MLIKAPIGELAQICEYPFRISVKNVRPIRMNEDALGVDRVEGVAANTGPASTIRTRCPVEASAGADSASVTSANDDEITCGHLSRMLSENFNSLLYDLHQLV